MSTQFDQTVLPKYMNGFPNMPHEHDLGDIRLILLPPGSIDTHNRTSVNHLDVNLAGAMHEFSFNSDRTRSEFISGETIAFAPAGTEYRLTVQNPLPGCLVEVNERRWNGWLEEGEIPRERLTAYFWRKDGVSAELARSGIRHLMRAAHSGVPTDRLTVEALALGIAARGMAQMTVRDGDIDAEVARWSRYARRMEINRAIDLIEARLCDSDLSIADLADTACLSSSRFSSVFRSMIGESPYAFILRRRAEFARDLIIGTREPLSQIAYDAGFSSQAHMTVVIRRVFGVTPAAMRN
ncbi:helix-turn-helix domain-containing protein [Pseudaestuariivita rosea]|uniref:helix-turn-helix domain-containing protein n=1 Tax=Pseudaestuariivita rosea TaxID=2763263 RepID=UPI001ABB8ECB|nr:AraC family transcriptional regulator [Pseudaestuariivita rosea]